ncbi:MAG: hypothetical protein ACOH2T_29260 [Pseudomonas sp.]
MSNDSKTATQATFNVASSTSTHPSILIANDTGIASYLAQLRERSAKWKARGGRFWLVAAVAAVVAGAVAGAALFLGADSAVSAALDIPAQIAAAMPSKGVSQLQQATDPATSALVTLGFVLGPMAILGGCLLWMASVIETSKAFQFMFMGGVMIFGSMLLHDGTSGSEGERGQKREVVSWVAASPLAQSPAGLYVRAQAELGREGSQDTAILKEAAASLRSGSADFETSPRVVYEIEHAAFGSVKTPAAKAYADAHIGNVLMLQNIAIVFGAIALGAGCIALLLSLLGWSLARRLRRLLTGISHQHLDPETDESESRSA